VLLRELQRRLAALYDAPADHDVHDFLITDAAHATALQGAAATPIFRTCRRTSARATRRRTASRRASAAGSRSGS
jgi:hypothetical protein